MAIQDPGAAWIATAASPPRNDVAERHFTIGGINRSNAMGLPEGSGEKSTLLDRQLGLRHQAKVVRP